MKHIYNEEGKEKIAQIVYDWMVSHQCPDAEMLCQCDSCTIDAVDLACDLADVKQVYFYEEDELC